MKFYKYHGLGNDYIVLDPGPVEAQLDSSQIRRICHRQCGVGSDGILLGPFPEKSGAFGVRIFNPDGSEAEKSGNGLRIFARYLHDQGMVASAPFTIATKGGEVTARLDSETGMISVEMGRVSFASGQIPVAGPEREVINEAIVIDGQNLTFCAATIGNPHCVIVRPGISAEETRRLGPVLETHELFPNRTNVQFARIIDRANLAIEIWERGAGYTLASGSSASAAAAVARRLGLCDADITVHMPGGKLEIRVDARYNIHLTGPVVRIADGRIHPEVFDQPAIADLF
jgi:diaminopimelate epimerase